MTQVQPLPDQNRFAPNNPRPSGLNSLSELDSIFVQQKVELLEVIVCCDTNNRYVLKDETGQELFKAHEETACLTRQCCGPLRPFELMIKDLVNDEPLIQLSRPLACGACCFPCCLQAISIYAPPGELAGRVEQEWNLCTPKFNVKNSGDEIIFEIVGPICTMACCSDVDFQILSVANGEEEDEEENEVGKISKQWVGLTKETFTDADTFGISFPPGIDVKMKATLLGALFLIDFMYYEGNQT